MTQDPGNPVRADARASSVKSENVRRSTRTAHREQEIPALTPSSGSEERTDALAEPIVVAQFWKNRRHDAVRITLKTYEGQQLVDVRQFYSAKDGTLQPTGKGIALSVLRLPELAAAITKAERRARDLGLIPGETS